MQRHFDLIAIGGGSGGLAVTKRAAQLGKRAAIVEASRLGGTCVNNGCVPKKIMWYAANLAHAVDDANGYGIPATRGATDWPTLVESRERYIEAINGNWQKTIDNAGITRLEGFARFTGSNTVEINNVTYTADHIVIATGGRPLLPAVPGAELGITSDGFFQLQTQPKSVAVVGGGYIGVELSGMLQGLGSAVTLFIRDEKVLHTFDTILSDNLTEEMVRQGVNIEKKFSVARLDRRAQGIAVTAEDGRQREGFDCVIWAVGRAPNTDSLNLAAAGIHSLSNGIIPVDEYQNTNRPGIYAIGDVTGHAPLTPVAIAAGRKLAERLFNNKPLSKVDYRDIPSVVFSHPPVGTVGLTEAQARERFVDGVTVYTTRFKPMRYALSSHGPRTAMKLVCVGEEERVVGLHIIGDSADEMLQGFAVAVKMGATKADLDNTIAIHPTAAEELVTMKRG